MKLDKSKPYGTVMGHPSASFEQDGKLFDGEGYELSEKKVVSAKVEAEVVARNINESIAFLKKFLSGGAVSETKIKVEGENKGFSWDDIKSAQAKVNLRLYKQGTATMWKLVDEA